MVVLLRRRHIRRGMMMRVLLHCLGQFPGLHYSNASSDSNSSSSTSTTHRTHIPLLPLTVRLTLTHDTHLGRLVAVLRTVLLRNTALHVPTGTITHGSVVRGRLRLVCGQVVVATVAELLLLDGGLHLHLLLLLLLLLG